MHQAPHRARRTDTTGLSQPHGWERPVAFFDWHPRRKWAIIAQSKPPCDAASNLRPSPLRVSLPQDKRYEQQFLDALKAIFIGTRVEGDSGYINLMRIKAT
jgi:hypothetical protein